MSTPEPSDVDRVFSEIYPQLRHLAHARLRRNQHLTLLDTGALVHECYLRLNPELMPRFARPQEALAYLSSVMRSVIVDAVRRRQALRRGEGLHPVPLQDLPEAQDPAETLEGQIVEIDSAVRELWIVEPRLAQVVEMKFFGGFTEQEIAQSLGLTERTVRRDWTKARALLSAALVR